MSASHPITTDLVRHNEPALRANNDLLRCKKKRAFSLSVGSVIRAMGHNLKKRNFAVVTWSLGADWQLVPASFGLGQGCRDGGRERQPDFHVMDLGDCIGERHPWHKAE